jgi:putative transposase
VALVTDVFSRIIVGASVSSILKTHTLPLHAIDIVASMVSDELSGLAHHSDRGANYMPLADTDRIVELGGTPSGGSKGGSHDDEMAEIRLAFFKTELMKKCLPWRSVEQVELANLAGALVQQPTPAVPTGVAHPGRS